MSDELPVPPCPNCGSESLYWKKTTAWYLLPGLGQGVLGNFADFRVVLCEECGLTRLFASPDALRKLRESGGETPWAGHWRKLPSAGAGGGAS